LSGLFFSGFFSPPASVR